MATKQQDNRIRNWTFVLYPESAPENWRDILDNFHIPWIESPLHDADLNADESEKKPHIHVALCFEGKKSFEQVLQITDLLNCPHPQYVQSMTGLVRYMIHMDNPEKHQYSRDQIVGHGGADVDSYLRPTSGSRYALLREMVDFIRSKDVIEYSDLVEYAMMERPDDWFPLLVDNSTIFISMYITSFRNKHMKRRKLRLIRIAERYTRNKIKKIKS